MILEAEQHAKIVANHLSYELFEVYAMGMDELKGEGGVYDDNFNLHFINEVRPLGVETIKIYNTEGVIVFCNNASLIGSKISFNENFKKALKKQSTTHVASAEYLNKVYHLSAEKDLVETYIPILDMEDNTKVIGVFEIYQSYDRISRLISNAIKRTIFSTMILMFCFSVVLFILIRKGNMIIASEKERLVKELEETVATRTKELSESEQKYKTFLDNVTDAVAVVDTAGNFVIVNNKTVEVTGYSADEISEMVFFDIVDKDSHAELEPVLMSLLSGDSKTFEVNVKRKNGSIVPLEVTSEIIQYNGNKMIMGAGRNISERKKMETFRNDFYSMLTHDFRVPLTPICGFAEVLLDADGSEISEKAREMVDVIYKNAKRLNHLIDDFLLSSKFESDKICLEDGEFELNFLLSEVLRNHEASISSKKLKLNRNLSSDVYLVKGDIAQMERAVSNLVNNAIKFNSENGVLGVSSERVVGAKGKAEIKIEIYNSDGCIGSEDLPYIFEKYRRADKSKKVSGTGLGLYISSSSKKKL